MNIIKSQYYELEVPSKEIFNSVSKSLPELNDRIMKNVFEKTEQALKTSDRILFIDKLELDVGKIKWRDIETELPLLIETEFINSIKDKLLRDEYYKVLNFNERNIYQEKSLKIKEPYSRMIEALIYFLRRGYFPWWIIENETQELQEKIRKSFEDISDSEYSELLVCIEDEVCFERMIALLGSESLIFLLDREYSSQSLNQIIIAINKAGLELKLDNKVNRAIEKKFLRILFSFKQTAGSIDGIVISSLKNFIQFIKNDFEKIFDKYVKVFSEMVSAHVDDVNFKNEILQTIKQNVTGIKSKADFPEKISSNDTDKTKAELKSYIDASKEDAPEDVPIDEIFISNSGLVLLFPYILNFFKNLKLINEDEFISRQHQQRAIHILDYIVNANEKVYEYQTSLNKILCGLDVSFPLDTDIELTNDEKLECEELMKSVIRNWTALKNTSPDGLRNAFLKRKGVIIKQEESYILRVERKSIDILLEKIPWSFSTIKLPWMKKIIHVEW